MSKSQIYRFGSLISAFLLIAAIILTTGSSPFAVIGTMLSGAFGSGDQLARVMVTLIPLLLCTAGVIYTFNAGLYNIGVEGQIVVGAVFATWALRLFQDSVKDDAVPGALAIIVALLAGGVGGMLWGLLLGVINVYGRVNEIFAGVGLNFMATGLAIYLVFGPWKRPGVASMSGTQPFDDKLWLSTIGTTELSPVGILIAALGLLITIILISRTHYGLRLRAVGNNLRASFILGIPATRQLFSAFAICGILAGLAGALQVLAVFHRLIPSISSNLGFLSLLVAMLITYNPVFILPVAFFFSALNIGALRLPSDLKLESALAGVIQGILVLFVLLGRGLSERYGKK
ncbi:MAG: ABC transporter permease [Anaerolineae bacterium]|nr:ABC transporter permease [Anaerolineae bacterium]